MVERLDTEARRQRCKGVTAAQRIEALLTAPRRQWQPSIPLDKISAADIQAATKLREALRPWLIRQHDAGLSSAEMDAAGVAEYRRIFGNAITPRYWRELFTRATQRDAGAENWNRLEIYLPERLRPKTPPAAVVSQALADDFAELESYLAACGNPHDPSAREREGIWTLAFDKFTSLVQQGTPEKSAARRVRQFLSARASFLAVSRDALLKAFNRKLDALQRQAGDVKALRDGRAENGERFELPENDRLALINRAARHYDDNLTRAWRDLLTMKDGFSREVVERYGGTKASKSYVPESVRDLLSETVRIQAALHRNKRKFLDDEGGHVTRSYEGISSLQCIQGDDFTMPCYHYIPDGQGWYKLTRGQVLLFNDFGSQRILGKALEPHKSYSSLTIRSLITNMCGEFGTPEAFYFERGIWESSALLKGKTDPFTFAEISQGMREFNIKFMHAQRARTKLIERIGGILQDMMEAEPGYCGRDERRDLPDRTRRQKAEVEARKTHPSKYFYSLEQWNTRLDELIRQYNAEPQQGIVLGGMSPDMAFKERMNANNPPSQFPAGLRYLLANDKRLAYVTMNGVTVQIGKKKFNYKGREIAHLVGREVLLWFDPENPEIITVTNPDRTNPICVTRSENPNALESLVDPESGTLGREMSRIEGQASSVKTLYSVLKAQFPLPQRQMLATAQAVELGAEITAQKTEITERQTRQRRQRSQASALAQRTGIYQPEQSRGTVAPERLNQLAKFLEDGNAEEKPQSLTQENGKFIYTLKPSNGGKE
jgi:hypothetical protein